MSPASPIAGSAAALTADRTTGPIAARDRALAPDLARGLMLALIAVANVGIYLYDRPYGFRQHILEPDWWDRATTAVVVGAVDARAYPLFAALFGYGVARIAARATDAGASPVPGPDLARRRLRRRAWALLAFGAVHALLLFSGDILGAYGLLSLALLRLVRSSDRVLLRIAAVAAVVAPLVQGVTMADPGPTTDRTLFWSVAVADPLAALVWRGPEWVIGTIGMLGVVPAALVGVWAGRRRILERPESHRVLLRRWAVGGVAVGLLGGLPAALVASQVWRPGNAGIAIAVSIVHVAAGLAGGLGYAAAIALVSLRAGRADRRGPITRALAAVGERSLTCYLAQSVVFVALLPAWTLGWGARLGAAAAAALALACWGLTVILAAALARGGRRGPAEALLRRIVYRPVGGSGTREAGRASRRASREPAGRR